LNNPLSFTDPTGFYSINQFKKDISNAGDSINNAWDEGVKAFKENPVVRVAVMAGAGALLGVGAVWLAQATGFSIGVGAFAITGSTSLGVAAAGGAASIGLGQACIEWCSGGTEQERMAQGQEAGAAAMNTANDFFSDPTIDLSRSSSSEEFVGSSRLERETVVEIWYNSIGGMPYTHAYVVVRTPNGQRFYFRGSPSRDPSKAFLAVSGASLESNNGAWGYLVAQGGLYSYDSIDYRNSPSARQVVLRTKSTPNVVLDSLIKFTNQVNNAGIYYDPLSKNSNSFAHQAVTELGAKRPVPTAWAPGSSTFLCVYYFCKF
jgi:hypothetical protein